MSFILLYSFSMVAILLFGAAMLAWIVETTIGEMNAYRNDWLGRLIMAVDRFFKF